MTSKDQGNFECPYRERYSNLAPPTNIHSSSETNAKAEKIGRGIGQVPGSGLEDKLDPTKDIEDFPICDYASQLLLDALDGYNPQLIDTARKELANCGPCLNTLDVQLKLRETISLHLRKSAPPHLRNKISLKIQQMKLGDLDITDFPPPKFK